MTKFAISPVAAGYAVTPGTEVVQVELNGGGPRTRKDVLNAASLIAVSWILTQEQYDYFWAFFRGVIDSGSLPFTIDLIIDTHTKATYTVVFVKDSVTVGTIDGGVFTINASLYANAATRDLSADAALVAAYNTAHGIT